MRRLLSSYQGSCIYEYIRLGRFALRKKGCCLLSKPLVRRSASENYSRVERRKKKEMRSLYTSDLTYAATHRGRNNPLLDDLSSLLNFVLRNSKKRLAFSLLFFLSSSLGPARHVISPRAINL